MKSFWQAAIGGHSADVVLKPEYCTSLRVGQQSAQSTAPCKVFVNILLCQSMVIVLDLLPQVWVLITVTASLQYFCGTSVFMNFRALSLPAVS